MRRLPGMAALHVQRGAGAEVGERAAAVGDVAVGDGGQR